MNPSLYTYALLKLPAPLALPRGIAGPLHIVTGTEASTDVGVAALVEPDLDISYLQADDDRLVAAVLTHDRVIQAIFQQTTVLPLRFGTCFASRTDLQAHLDNPRSPYGPQLQRLDGQAEYRVKLLPTAQPLPPLATTLTGKAYFLAKKQQIQAEADLLHQQADELNAFVSQMAQTYAVRRDEPSRESPEGVENLYVLGDRSAAAALLNQITLWNSHAQHWQAMCGEALPPYHFIEPDGTA